MQLIIFSVKRVSKYEIWYSNMLHCHAISIFTCLHALRKQNQFNFWWVCLIIVYSRTKTVLNDTTLKAFKRNIFSWNSPLNYKWSKTEVLTISRLYSWEGANQYWMKDYLMWILNIELKTNSSLHVFRAEIEGDIQHCPDIGGVGSQKI